jgi:hypothetical protein
LPSGCAKSFCTSMTSRAVVASKSMSMAGSSRS